MEKTNFNIKIPEKKDNKRFTETFNFIYDNLQVPHWIIIKAWEKGGFHLLDRIAGDIKHGENFNPPMKYLRWILKTFK